MKGLLKSKIVLAPAETHLQLTMREETEMLCAVSPQSHHEFWICFEYFFPFFSLLYDLWDIGNTQQTLRHQCNSTDFAAVGGVVI